MKHNPHSLEFLKSLRKDVRNVNVIQNEKLSPLDKLALWITDHVGTMGFFILIFVWTTLWLGWNMVAPPNMCFDPFPAFVMWLFLSNMIQIFLMPLIMIGQNLQSKHSEARAEADFEINKKAELEVETILQHLENQNELIINLVKRLDEKDSFKLKTLCDLEFIGEGQWQCKNCKVIQTNNVPKAICTKE